MSITGTGIVNNASAASATLTPTINFTLATALTSSQTLKIILNGTVVNNAGGLASTDLTPGGGCSGTPTMTTIPNTTANPTLSITGLTCTTAASTIAVAASRLVASSTPSNYSIIITTPSDDGAFFYYVGSLNLVTITANVDPTLSFTIVDGATGTSQLSTVSGGSSGPLACPLTPNPLSTGSVSTCSYRLKIATNAQSGFSVSYKSNTAFTDGTYTMTDAAATTGTTIAAGTETYGAKLDAGKTTPSGASNTRSAVFGGSQGNGDTKAYQITSTSVQTLYTSASPNNPAGSDTTNTALVTHQVAISATTGSGAYSHTVTYTVSAIF